MAMSSKTVRIGSSSLCLSSYEWMGGGAAHMHNAGWLVVYIQLQKVQVNDKPCRLHRGMAYKGKQLRLEWSLTCMCIIIWFKLMSLPNLLSNFGTTSLLCTYKLGDPSQSCLLSFLHHPYITEVGENGW